MRCLAKNPNDRFETGSELAAAIEAALAPFQVAVAKKRSVQKVRTGDSSSMRGLAGGALGAIAVLAIAALGAWLLQRSSASGQQQPAPAIEAAPPPRSTQAAPASAPTAEQQPAAPGATRPPAGAAPGSAKTAAPPVKKTSPAPTELVDPWGERDGR
jgi:hypothetical protein